MSEALAWRRHLPAAVRPYLEPAALAALALGVSSGFPYAMIGATLTTRLAQDGIDKRAVTAFALAFLAYNLKWSWAFLIDAVPIPWLGRRGQRVGWMLFSGLLVIASVAALAIVDPKAGLAATALAAVAVGVAGATFDVVIDAYRIELLRPEQLGVGSGMSQYGWRIGAAAAGALALLVAESHGWTLGYLVCTAFALPAMVTALVLGEPERRRQQASTRPDLRSALTEPLREFLARQGAWLILGFVLLHKVGDTLANLSLRLLLQDLGFSNAEIAFYDVGFGFTTLLLGIYVGGILYARLGVGRSVAVSLWLMAVSNLGFAVLALVGHHNATLAAVVGFENFASGIGGVTVVAYLSALCNLRFTASQYALLSAGASVLGRLLAGTGTGALIVALGYVPFYLITTFAALPGIWLFWHLCRRGLLPDAARPDGSAAAP